MRGALVGGARADGLQRLGRPQPDGRKRDLLERHGQLDIGIAEPQVTGDAAGKLPQLIGGGLLIFEAPPPVLATTLCHPASGVYERRPALACSWRCQRLLPCSPAALGSWTR